MRANACSRSSWKHSTGANEPTACDHEPQTRTCSSRIRLNGCASCSRARSRLPACRISRCRSANRATPRPTFILDALRTALPSIGSYPATLGIPELRVAAAALARRGGTACPPGSLDPDDHGAAGERVRAKRCSPSCRPSWTTRQRSLPCVMPNPFYQIYEGAALLAGAEPVFLNATAENHYLPDLAPCPTPSGSAASCCSCATRAIRPVP